LADGEGRLFKRLGPWDGTILPVMTGLDRDEAGRNSEMVAERIRQGLRLLAAMERQARGLGNVSELHWDSDLGWSVIVDGDAPTLEASTRLVLGREPELRLAVLARAVGLVKSQGLSPATVWSDGSERPGQIAMKMNPAPSTHDGQTFVATAR